MSSPTFWEICDQPEPGSFFPRSLLGGEIKNPGNEVGQSIVCDGKYQSYACVRERLVIDDHGWKHTVHVAPLSSQANTSSLNCQKESHLTCGGSKEAVHAPKYFSPSTTK